MVAPPASHAAMSHAVGSMAASRMVHLADSVRTDARSALGITSELGRFTNICRKKLIRACLGLETVEHRVSAAMPVNRVCKCLDETRTDIDLHQWIGEWLVIHLHADDRWRMVVRARREAFPHRPAIVSFACGNVPHDRERARDACDGTVGLARGWTRFSTQGPR